MRVRPPTKLRAALESLEEVILCSAGLSRTPASGAAEKSSLAPPDAATLSAEAVARKPEFGYLVYRITNPNIFNDHINLPIGHVLVQPTQPVPGEVYNVLYVTVRNGTNKTFDASSDFLVRFPGQKQSMPILTGDEQWKPGQNYTFYVLTKKYYPLASQVHSGYEFRLDGARSVAIPGPSGIFLRLKYDPATIDQALDQIVRFGAGAQGGKGIKFGLPDTAINEFVSARTSRRDFGGYF